MALRRTTASNLFTKFLNYKIQAPAINSPLITRSVASTTIGATTTSSSSSSLKKKQHNNGSDNLPVTVTGAPQKFEMENPFQLAGPSNVIEVHDLKNNGGALVRVAMPGVGDDGFRVWTENSTVFFMGRGEIEYEEDDCGRKYGGSLEFSPELYKPDAVKAEMKNGILRLSVPNAEGAEQK